MMNYVYLKKIDLKILCASMIISFLTCSFLTVIDIVGQMVSPGLFEYILSDVIAAFVAGTTIYIYQHRKKEALKKKLEVIDLMNHHIRNAVQPLMLMTDEVSSKARAKEIENSVERINWALNEILPKYPSNI
jgi:hypothetical protein